MKKRKNRAKVAALKTRSSTVSPAKRRKPAFRYFFGDNSYYRMPNDGNYRWATEVLSCSRGWVPYRGENPMKPYLEGEEVPANDVSMYTAEFMAGLGENLEYYFDVRRGAAEKRKEFAEARAFLLKVLTDRYGSDCQLRLSPKCTGIATELDHLMPLATNKLNKLRGDVAPAGHKVPSQSFGSNFPINLVPSCRACIANKKHRLLSRDELMRVLAKRFSRLKQTEEQSCHSKP